MRRGRWWTNVTDEDTRGFLLLTRPLVGAGPLIEDCGGLRVGNRIENGLVVLGQGGPRRRHELK
jgi:hypothetical protein